MNRIIFAIIVSIATFFSTGCTTRCTDQFITPAFVGFSIADLDTVVVRRFTKDGNFSSPLDTAVISLRGEFLESATSNDTTIVLLNHISGQEKIYLPGQ